MEKAETMASSWSISSVKKIRYFLVASILMISQVVGLLFLGLWLGQRISFIATVLGATIGGMLGLASGTICLYYMAIRWERMALEKMGKQIHERVA